jgi:hypothetical protein
MEVDCVVWRLERRGGLEGIQTAIHLEGYMDAIY